MTAQVRVATLLYINAVVALLYLLTMHAIECILIVDSVREGLPTPSPSALARPPL